MERTSEVPTTVAKLQANPVANKLFSKIAARGGVTAKDAITDFSAVMEAQSKAANSSVPATPSLTDAEKSMNFADLIQSKMSEAQGSSTEDIDRQVRELQDKYKLSDRERSLLVDEMSSNLKGGGGGGLFKSLLKFILELVGMGFMDDE